MKFFIFLLSTLMAVILFRAIFLLQSNVFSYYETGTNKRTKLQWDKNVGYSDLQIDSFCRLTSLLYTRINFASAKLIHAMDFQVSWIGQPLSVKFENVEDLLCWFLTRLYIRVVYTPYVGHISYIDQNVQGGCPSKSCNLMKRHWQLNIYIHVFMLCVCVCAWAC